MDGSIDFPESEKESSDQFRGGWRPVWSTHLTFHEAFIHSSIAHGQDTATGQIRADLHSSTLNMWEIWDTDTYHAHPGSD